MPRIPPPQSSPYRWPIRVGFVLILVVLVVRIFGPARSSLEYSHASTDLGKLSIVPPFTLTERSGKTITNHDLAGKIWVASFVYTTCPGPCPLITAGMAKIQAAVANDPQVQLVSFTVDPDTDTPAGSGQVRGPIRRRPQPLVVPDRPQTTALRSHPERLPPSRAGQFRPGARAGPEQGYS